MEVSIPVWEKYVLSIDEASSYFHIGTNQLRKLIASHKDAEWILWNSNRAQIKRKKFEHFIDSTNSL